MCPSPIVGSGEGARPLLGEFEIPSADADPSAGFIERSPQSVICVIWAIERTHVPHIEREISRLRPYQSTGLDFVRHQRQRLPRNAMALARHGHQRGRQMGRECGLLAGDLRRFRMMGGQDAVVRTPGWSRVRASTAGSRLAAPTSVARPHLARTAPPAFRRPDGCARSAPRRSARVHRHGNGTAGSALRHSE